MPEPLKILQLTTNFKQGGIQRHILDVTTYLRDHGHQVTLAGAPNVWANSQIDPDFRALRLDLVSAANGSFAGRLKAMATCAHGLSRIVEEGQFDVIHCHESAPAIVKQLSRRARRIPTVITYHGSAPGRATQYARVSKYCADYVVSPSRLTLDDLIGKGVPAGKARVMGLGVSPLPEPDRAIVENIRAELQLGPKDKLVFSLSRLDVQKGIDIMVEVARCVLSRDPNVVFAVGGTGPLADEVLSWPMEVGIGERFRFLGGVSGVENYFELADLFLLTSRWEALPISIVEAFRGGLPVIATDCGGVSELVDDSVGRLCPVEDEEALTGAILELLGDEPLRASLAASALERSKSPRFDPEAVHSSFEALYREAAASRG